MNNFTRFLYFTAFLLLFSCGGDPCDDIDCGVGTCIDGTCDCPDGYSGINCEILAPCITISCGPNGDCIDGLCDCDEGYEGEFCEIEFREKFLGTWVSPDFNCDGTIQEATFIITPGLEVFEVRIIDPLEPSLIYFGVIEGNEIVITIQNTFSGNLELIQDNQLDISFVATAGGTTFECRGIAEKQ